jgi:hypothetical protein
MMQKENNIGHNAELNSLINQGMVDLSKELGGEVTSATITTDADGFGDLPADILEIYRMEYEGARMSRITYEEFAELEETS